MSYTLYNSVEVEKLLRELVPLQDAIEQASEAFLKLGENGFQKKLVEDWESNFQHFYGPEHHTRRLSFLYLANDIVQKCRNRAPGYIEGFRSALCKAFRQMIDSRDEHNIQPATQLTELWKSRRVFPKETVKEMQEILSEPLPPSSAKKDERDRNAGEIPEGLIRVPQELIPFIDATKELDKWRGKTTEAENKVRNVLNEDYFNEDEAGLHLAEYKKCLELEQKYRTNLIKSEIELMRQSDTDHVKYVHMLKKVTNLLEEIENNL